MQHNWREIFGYNPDTGELFWKINRGARKVKGKLAGHKNINGYVHIKYKEKLYKAHRIVHELYHNETIPEELVIDHINRIRDDNRVDNLRCATHSENCCNNNATYVRKRPNCSTWQARPPGMYLGSFKTENEAKDAVTKYLNTKKKEGNL